MTLMSILLQLPSSILLQLPSDVFLHILTRLPLKYLMKLRCVSKYFLYLTNNPNFIVFYSKTSLGLDFNFMDTTTTTLYSSLSLPSHESNQWQWPWRFHISFKGSNFIYLQKHHELIPFHCPSHKRLIGSMNGLVCFGNFFSIEIYNILAGTNYNLIPPSAYIVPDPTYVFGYDPISHDYKILRIDKLKIYSFRTNSWKFMNLTKIYGLVLKGRAVCINGIIYWPPGKALGLPDYNGGFLSYDLHRDMFTVFESPEEACLLPPTGVEYTTDIQLLSFRGCLAFPIIKRITSRTKTKPRIGKRGGDNSSSHGGGGIWVELYILMKSNREGGDEGNYLWTKESFVVPISPPKEAEIVSYFDQIFLGWLESNQLRLYNLYTKCFFNLPLSQSSSDYYPKVSLGKKKNDPTYVHKLSFDFSLI